MGIATPTLSVWNKKVNNVYPTCKTIKYKNVALIANLMMESKYHAKHINALCG